MNKKETVLAFLIIALGVLSRFLPHVPNFVPVTAIAIFGGRYFSKYYAWVIPFAIMSISDIFLGFSDVTLYVYAGLALAIFGGTILKKHYGIGNLVAVTFASSVGFFLVSNFGVWMAGWYGRTLPGLIKCYEMAIPFFRNSLAGDLFYVTVMFGAYEIVRNRLFSKWFTTQQHI